MGRFALLLFAGAGGFFVTVGTASQASKSKCPAPGTEVPFAKVMNEAFARDFVGCDITARVEFVAAGGTPSYVGPRKGDRG